MRTLNRALSRLIKLAVLVFCLSGNLAVKAASESQKRAQQAMKKQLVEEPKNCLVSEELICGVKSQGVVKQFTSSGVTFHMAPQSIVLRLSPESWYLSKGEIWVSSARPVNLRTQSGEVVSQGVMSVYLASSEAGVRVLPLEEDCVVVPNGSGVPYEVPVGLEAQFEGRTQKGEGYLRLARSPQLPQVLKSWGQLYSGSGKGFAQKAKQYELKWGVQADRLKAAQFDLYQREVASAEEVRRRRLEGRKRYEAKKKQLRDLFKKKTYY